MVYFREIRKTKHYIEHHEYEVPWQKVVEIIFTVNNPRRNGETFEIEDKQNYLVFKIEKGILSVINAKRK